MADCDALATGHYARIRRMPDGRALLRRGADANKDQSYFLCGLMDVMVGSMRGMGYSFLPMIVSLIGACGLRVVWIFTVFQWHRSLFTLYLSYPITWTITALAHMACWYVVMYKKQPNK